MVQAALPGAALESPALSASYRDGRERTLSAVLGEFAANLSKDSPVQEILDHFVKRIVEILPITSAGVTLISAGSAPHYVAASDDAALRFEQLQSNIGEGPCVSAYKSGQPVVVPDLRVERRFPRFAPAAVTAGLAAVFTFPMRDGEGRLGALDLYRDAPGDLDSFDMAAAQTLADVVAAYLLNAQARATTLAMFDSLQQNALHDPLTGLVNRLLLRDRIDHAAQLAIDSGARAAIFLTNIDDFKVLNDTHGRQFGDLLLRAAAERLSEIAGPSDTLARFADDKFVLLCENTRQDVDVEHITQRLESVFSEPFTLTGADQPVSITASIAVIFAGTGSTMTSDLLVQGDEAMQNARLERDAPQTTQHVIDLHAAVKERTGKPSAGQHESLSIPLTLVHPTT